MKRWLALFAVLVPLAALADWFSDGCPQLWATKVQVRACGTQDTACWKAADANVTQDALTSLCTKLRSVAADVSALVGGGGVTPPSQTGDWSTIATPPWDNDNGTGMMTVAQSGGRAALTESGTGYHYLRYTVPTGSAPTLNTPYALTATAEKGSCATLWLELQSQGARQAQAYFDLIAGTVQNTTNGATGTIVASGNKWVATVQGVFVSAPAYYLVVGCNDGNSAPGSGVSLYVDNTVSFAKASVKPSITTFTASPSGVSSGQAATLSWTVTGATTVSIDNGVGVVSAGTTTQVTPNTTTTYTLTATNSAGTSTATATVTVAAANTVLTPTHSPAAGSYPSFVDVTLTSDTPGATIYYTTDGTAPSASGGGAAMTQTFLYDATDTTTAGNVSSGANLSWTTGDLIVCTTRYIGNSTITAATLTGGTGLTWTKAAGGQDTGYGVCQLYWAVAASPQTSQAAVFHLNSDATLVASNGKGIACYKFANAKNSAPIGSAPAKTNTFSAAPLATTITPGVVGSAILAVGAESDTSTAPTYISTGEGTTTQDGVGSVNGGGKTWSAHTALTTTTTARAVGTTAPAITNATGYDVACAWEVLPLNAGGGGTSSVYASAIHLTSTATVKALAAKTAMTTSGVDSAAYTITTPATGGIGTGGTNVAKYLCNSGGSCLGSAANVTGAGAMPSLVGLPNADACQSTADGAATRTCLQNALDAAATAGKAALIVNGPHTYTISDVIYSRVGIIGQGASQPTIYRNTHGSNSDAAIIKYKGTRGVSGVAAGAINNIWVYNLHLKGGYTGCGGTWESSVDACDPTGGAEGSQGIMLGAGSNYTIKGNYIETPDDDCIGDGWQPVDGDAGYGDSHNVLIDGNTCVNPYRTSIASTGSISNWLIINNVLEKKSGQINWAIDVEPNNSARRVNNVEIAYNQITNTYPSTGETGTAFSSGTSSSCNSGCPGSPSNLYLHHNFGSWRSTASPCNGFWVVHSSNPVAWTSVTCETTNSP